MNRKTRNRLLVALFLIPSLYLVFQMWAAVRKPYQLQTALPYTVEDAVPCEGLVVRNETVLRYGGNGVLSFAVPDGEKVSKGAGVVDVYASPQQAQALAKAADIEAQLAVLQEAQQSSSAGLQDISQLKRKIQGAHGALADILDNGNYGSLKSRKVDLMLQMNRLQITTGKDKNFAGYIAALEEQKKQALAAAGNPIERVSAPAAGYFISTVDGYEQLATRERIAPMTPAELAQFIAQPPATPPAGMAGKIDADYKWSFFAVLPADTAQRLKKGQSLQISFLHTAANAVPAQVMEIAAPKGSDTAKVELQCMQVTADTVRLRTEKAQLIFRTYKGLQIDKKALHIVDGVDGVYIKHGDVVLLKKVKPIYETKEYFIVPMSPEEGNELRLYDEIIVEGRDLYNGKILL